jgi:TolA-binding protein
MQTLWLLWMLASDNSATEARFATQAAILFQDGQERLQAGKYGTAKLAFQALISVYPESPLAPQARQEMLRSEELEQKQQRATVVRSIRFEKLRILSAGEIMSRFQEREVGLAVEQRCDQREVKEAKAVLTELLTEKGVANPRVKVQVHHHAARKVDITFHLE